MKSRSRCVLFLSFVLGGCSANGPVDEHGESQEALWRRDAGTTVPPSAPVRDLEGEAAAEREAELQRGREAAATAQAAATAERDRIRGRLTGRWVNGRQFFLFNGGSCMYEFHRQLGGGALARHIMDQWAPWSLSSDSGGRYYITVNQSTGNDTWRIAYSSASSLELVCHSGSCQGLSVNLSR